MRILISGAGIAGLSTAVNLGATGHDVTIVERADHLRVNGSPIDIRGDAIGVADKMGVLGQILDRRIDMTEQMQFVDSNGAVVAELPGDLLNDSPDDIEIPREDLATILHDELGPAVELRSANPSPPSTTMGAACGSASPRAPSTATTSWWEPTGCTRPFGGSRSGPSSSFCATSAFTSRSPSCRTTHQPGATTRCTTSRAA